MATLRTGFRESWRLGPLSSLFLCLLLLIPLVYTSYVYRDHQLDDGLIYQRYIVNCLRGEGLVYNPGEYVNGLTSPLYGYVVLLTSWLIGDVQLSTVLLSSALNFLTAMLLVLLVFSSGGGWNPWKLAGALVAAAAQVMIRYSYLTYGMESGLFVFLSGLALWLYLKEQNRWCWWVLAAVWLTRPEGIFLIAAIGLDLLRRERRLPEWGFFAIPGGAMLLQVSFNWLYYGTLLTTAGIAKIEQGESGFWGRFPFISYIGDQMGLVFANHYWGLFLLVGIAAIGFLLGAPRRIQLVAGLFLGLDFCFYLIFRIPSHIWYYAPFYFFFWLFLGLGVNRIVAGFWGRMKALVAVLLSTACWALFLSLLSFSMQTAGWANRDDYREIGLWVKQNTPPEASLAAVEIGTLGYYSDRRIIDILGLVSPPNSEFIARGDFSSWMDHYQPDYVLIHNPHWGFENEAEAARRRGVYVSVADFPFQGFRLLQRRPAGGGS